MKKKMLCQVVVLLIFVLSLILVPETCHSSLFSTIKDGVAKTKDKIKEKLDLDSKDQNDTEVEDEAEDIEENNSSNINELKEKDDEIEDVYDAHYIEELKKEERAIIEFAEIATSCIGEGTRIMLEAVKNKKLAVEIKKKMKKIKKKSKDPQNIKIMMNSVSKGNKALKEFMESKVELSLEAKKKFGEGIIWFGAGNILDVKAGEKTKKYARKLKETINNLTSNAKINPLEHGAEAFKATKPLKKSLKVTKFIGETLKEHLPEIGKMLTRLLKYASTLGLDISDVKIERKAENTGKEEGFPM